MATFDDFYNGVSKPVAAAMDAAVLSTAQAYTDAVAAGKDFKDSCRLVTIAALAAYARAGNVITASANGAMPTIDGIAPIVGDSILLKNGAAGADNWIYTINSIGGVGSKWKMTRRTDSDSDAKVTSGACVEISEGSQAGTAWYIATADPITLNTTSITVSQWAGRVDTDGTFAANSDARIPTQKAVKTGVDAAIATAAADATSKANTAQTNAIAASQPLSTSLTSAAALDGTGGGWLATLSGVATWARLAFGAYFSTVAGWANAAAAKASLGYYTSGDTFVGNLTGNASGSSGSCTGNAATATTAPSGVNTGDQTITLTGDVTGSGTGSFAATITALAVTAAKLAASAVTDAKLSLTTPALGAPTLSGKITNYNSVATVENGVPSSVVSVASTGNVANKAATTLLTPAGAGKYRMTVVTTVTTAASTTSSLPRTNMIYTDLNSVVKTIMIAPAFAGVPNLTTGIGATGTGLLDVKAGTAIQYSTGGTGGDYASTGGTAMAYDIHVVLEAI